MKLSGKRIFALVLSLCMVASMLPLNASAEEITLTEDELTVLSDENTFGAEPFVSMELPEDEETEAIPAEEPTAEPEVLSEMEEAEPAGEETEPVEQETEAAADAAEPSEQENVPSVETTEPSEEYCEEITEAGEPVEPDMAVVPATQSAKVASVVIQQGKLLTVNVHSEKEITLSASCLPAESNQQIQWSSTIKPENGYLRDNGDGTATLYGLKLTKNAVVSFTAKATSADNKGKSATISVKLTAEALPGEMHISGTKSAVAGTTQTYQVVFDSAVVDKSVVWSLREEDRQYASVSGGKLKANSKLNAGVEIVLSAALKNNPNVNATFAVYLVPKASSAQISVNGEVLGKEMSWDLRRGSRINLVGSTQPVDASNEGTWKSSATKIATVDDAGNVTFLKSGTATITFTASDGSSKKATVKITAFMPVTKIEIAGNATMTAGQKQTLQAFVNEDATNQKVTWISSDSKIATVSSSGALSAKAPGTVTITALAADGTGMSSAITVRILPKVASVTLLMDGAPITAKSVPAGIGTVVHLDAVIAPEGASTAGTWKSSSAKAATVDASGNVTFLAKGSVTITFTASDGSSKNAKVKFSVEETPWSPPHF